MIRYRNGAYEVIVHIGQDPTTGKPKRVSKSVRMPRQKRTPARVLAVEAELRTRVDQKLRVELAEGEYGDASRLTVADLLDRWLEHARGDIEPTTLTGYERCIRLYLKPTIGNVKIAKLTPARLDATYRALVASGGVDGAPLSPTTVRLTHAVMRQALQQATRWEWITRNPATVAKPPATKKYDQRTPTPDEIAKLISGADDDLGDLIAVAAGLGLRRGEACALRWSDLRDGYALIQWSAIELGHKVTVKAPKSGKARQAPLGPTLADRLRARLERVAARAERFGGTLDGAAYVLSDEVDGSLPLHPNLASDRFRRHAAKEGIPVRLHDLRHAKATYALASGVPAPDVARAMGWASTKMLFDTYGHHTAVHDEALAAVNDF